MMKCLKSGWALVFMIQGVVLMGQDISKLLPTEVLQEYNALITKLDYNKTIKPILSDKCFACHGNDANKRQAELRLDFAAIAPLIHRTLCCNRRCGPTREPRQIPYGVFCHIKSISLAVNRLIAMRVSVHSRTFCQLIDHAS